MRRARFLVLNGQNIRTFDVDSLDWPCRPETADVSTVIYFRTDKAIISINGKRVVIDWLDLLLNVGYDVLVLPEFFDHYLKGSPVPDWMKGGK